MTFVAVSVANRAASAAASAACASIEATAGITVKVVGIMKKQLQNTTLNGDGFST